MNKALDILISFLLVLNAVVAWRLLVRIERLEDEISRRH